MDLLSLYPGRQGVELRAGSLSMQGVLSWDGRVLNAAIGGMYPCRHPPSDSPRAQMVTPRACTEDAMNQTPQLQETGPPVELEMPPFSI